MSYRFMVNRSIMASLSVLDAYHASTIFTAILDYVSSDGEIEPAYPEEIDEVELAIWILIRNELNRENDGIFSNNEEDEKAE